MFGPLHYRHLDMDKTVALKLRKGNYNKTMTLLDQTVYDQAIQLLNVTPSIDLFASRLNYKCKPNVSFRPDPEAQAINAFHIYWVNM
jgi:hypothetical protein